MSAPDVALSAVALATIALVGRIALALLPRGRPGRHGLGELPITWAASHLLGSLVLVAERDLIAVLGFAASAVSLLAPWGLVLILRWTTLPGGLVPRHAPRTEIASLFSRTIELAAGALVVVVACTRTSGASMAGASEGVAATFVGPRPGLPTSLATTNALATLCLCAAGMQSARRAPLGRSTVMLALSAMLALLGATVGGHGELSSIVMCTAGAAGFGIAWLRRADKRARMLAILASTGAALLGGVGAVFALALLTGIVVCTAAPARARTAVISAIALGIAAALAFAGDRGPAFDAAADGPPAPDSRLARLAIAVLLLACAGFLARKLWRAGGPVDAATTGEIDEPRRELSALGYSAGISLALCAALGWLTPARPSPAVLAPLLPICALMIGLALVRSEQPFERA